MAVTGTPTSGDDTLTGDGADDQIIGQQGNDLIDGGGGVDVIYGDVPFAFNGPLNSNQAPNTWSLGSLDGWFNSGSGGNIERRGAGFQGLTPADGSQFIELDGNTAGRDHVQTNLELDTGVEYILSVDHAARAGSSINDDFQVTHNGTVVATISPSTTTYFTTTEITITGLVGTDTIGFRELNSQDSSQGVLLDNISVGLSPASAAASGFDFNDTIDGGAGDDSIYGQEGDDVLEGGAGDDYLEGGIGSDTFAMADGGGNDVVGDFEVGTDLLDVANLTDADGNPVNVYDVTVTSDGEAGSILTFPNGETIRLVGIAPEEIDTPEELETLGIPCFAAGTLIDTPAGPVLVEALGTGDIIWAERNGCKTRVGRPVLRVFRRKLSALELMLNEKLKPIRIKAGALGGGLPRRDLLVSRQHRMLVRSKIVDRMFGVSEVLVPAFRLLELPGVCVEEDAQGVEYVHIFLEAHEIIFAEGAPTESLFSGKEALGSISKDAREELVSIFPEFEDPAYQPVPARCVPAPAKQTRLVHRHVKNRVPLLADWELAAREQGAKSDEYQLQ